jgi:hypothetical protein
LEDKNETVLSNYKWKTVIMLSTFPHELIYSICSFLDANTVQSFTATNSTYNQAEDLYREYIRQNYSPEQFGVSVWDHTVFKNKGLTCNKTTWKGLFYRINSHKNLHCRGDIAFPIYFKETLRHIVQRCQLMKEGRDLFTLSCSINGYILELSNNPEKIPSLGMWNTSNHSTKWKQIPWDTIVGSVINDDNCLFDMIAFMRCPY